MDKIIDLHELKSEDYITLTSSLKEILFEYWNLLKSKSKKDFLNYMPFNYEIIRILNLNDKLKIFLLEMILPILMDIIITKQKH